MHVELYRNSNLKFDWRCDFTYFLFFPKILLGPIERYPEWRTKLAQWKSVPGDTTEAVLRIFLGLFKKVVIAGSLVIVVDQVFARPSEFNSLVILGALLLLRWQIYMDFSAAADIAIGSASLMGIRLRENFDFPFKASSVSDQWRRWHMSLAEWFRDYIFYPLAKLNPERWWLFLSLLIAFTLVGIWHGFKPTLLVWGALQALFIGSEYLIRGVGKHRIRVPEMVKVAFTMLVLALGAVFFYARDLTQAEQVFSALVETSPLDFTSASLQMERLAGFRQKPYEFYLSIGLVILAQWFHLRSKDAPVQWFLKWDFQLQLIILVMGLLAVIFAGKWGVSEFVYQQF